jgi:hypothetical protein
LRDLARGRGVSVCSDSLGVRAWAVLIPGLLFALAQVPGQVAEHRTMFEITGFFALNASLVACLFFVADRSQDESWLGILHYFMDVAIAAI